MVARSSTRPGDAGHRSADIRGRRSQISAASIRVTATRVMLRRYALDARRTGQTPAGALTYSVSRRGNHRSGPASPRPQDTEIQDAIDPEPRKSAPANARGRRPRNGTATALRGRLEHQVHRNSGVNRLDPKGLHFKIEALPSPPGRMSWPAAVAALRRHAGAAGCDAPPTGRASR